MGFAALLIWFDRVDFYSTKFDLPGPLVTWYQTARLLFTLYLFWMVYAVGVGVLVVMFGRAALADLQAWEQVPLCFAVGIGLSHLILFCLGLAGFYQKSVIAGLAMLAMVLSLPHLANGFYRAMANFAERNIRFTRGSVARFVLVLLSGMAACVFFLTKGSYPAGGHDYYNHYFPFYMRVIETGSIFPNDVWYHFFDCKGAGLFFASMLLTDPLAPQLVGTAFVGCTTLTVYAILRRTTNSSLVAWLGVALWILFFIYTPGPPENYRQGGWGDLEKIHELAATAVLLILWIIYRLVSGDLRAPGPWLVALFSAIVGLTLLTIQLTIVIGTLFGLLLLILMLRYQWKLARNIFLAWAVSVCSVVAILAINHKMTGLFGDQLIHPLWRWTDLSRLDKWGVAFEALDGHWAMTHRADHPSIPILSWDLLSTFANFLRVDVWWPLLLMATLLSILAISFRDTRKELRCRLDVPFVMVFGLFFVTTLLIAFFLGGRSQPISFYRMTTFNYGVMLCAALMSVWTVAGCKLYDRWIVVPVVLVLITSAFVWYIGKSHFSNAATVVSNARDLFLGRMSLKAAYQDQKGWPGRLPWGGIYPGVEVPAALVGPGVRIWSFHVHSYCMLPNCNVQGISSFRFSRSWRKLFLGDAEQAVEILKQEALDYFFFSKELSQFEDPLPLQLSLLSPEQISRHLAVRWTDGTSYLLTWISSGTTPITPDFLEAYKKAVSTRGSWPATIWKKVAIHMEKNKVQLQPFKLPWCTNCEGLPELDNFR